MNAMNQQEMQSLSNAQLDALEEETIFILREVAASFERPALLFSGGKDSLVLLKCAEKAFGGKDADSGKGRVPYPLLMIDTGHNFAEVTQFRDERAQELGAQLIVRSVEDSMRRGTVRRGDERMRAPAVSVRMGAPSALSGRIAGASPWKRDRKRYTHHAPQ